MKTKAYNLKSEVWLYPDMSGWHFISVAKKQSEEIKKLFADFKKGWGSLPVEVKTGKTIWRTSIFPDKQSGCYLLPLKAKVRKQEGIMSGDKISFTIKISV